MPFITEEIWQRAAAVADGTLAGAERSIMLQPWPEPALEPQGTAIESEMRWVQEFVLGIRRIRAEMDIAPAKPLPVLVEGAAPETRARVERHRGFLGALARLEKVEVLVGEAPAAAAALLGEAKLLVPMEGLIDKGAELARLDKLIAKLEAEVPRIEAKLANQGYVSRAPAEVVAKDRARLAELAQQLAEYRAQRAKVEEL
jgi:valyl-tRNA synthetase